MPSYLARHYDPALEIDHIAAREDLEREQVDRLKRSLAIVLMASSIPRRLGADASDDELALDKKRARRTSHALKQALTGWSKRPGDLPMNDGIRIEGAQTSWQGWAEAHVASIKVQLRVVSTYAVKKDEEPWGKSAVVKLENEINWVTYALRD